MVSILLGESRAINLDSIPLADNTTGGNIQTCVDLWDKLIAALKCSHFGLQVGEAIYVVKDVCSVTYVHYVSAS